jgi:hypothetical protein
VIPEFEYGAWERLLDRLGIYDHRRRVIAGEVAGAAIIPAIVIGGIVYAEASEPWRSVGFGFAAAGAILFFAVATILAFLWVFDKVARLLGYTRTEPTR